MKITVTIMKKSPIHIHFNVFVNGALSGSLVLRNEEWEQFMAILQPEKIRDNVEAVQSYKDMGEGLDRLYKVEPDKNDPSQFPADGNDLI